MGIYYSDKFYGVRWLQKSSDGDVYHPIYIRIWETPMGPKEWEEVVAAYYAIPEVDRNSLQYLYYTEISSSLDVLYTNSIIWRPISKKEFERAIAIHYPEQ